MERPEIIIRGRDGSLTGLNPGDFSSFDELMDRFRELDGEIDDWYMVPDRLQTSYEPTHDLWAFSRAFDDIAEEFSEDAAMAYGTVSDISNMSPNQMVMDFESRYEGYFDGYEEFGRHMVEVYCLDMPPELDDYMDYYNFGRDALEKGFVECDGFYFAE